MRSSVADRDLRLSLWQHVREAAYDLYRRAAKATASIAERRFLEARAAAVATGGSSR